MIPLKYLEKTGKKYPELGTVTIKVNGDGVAATLFINNDNIISVFYVM